MTLFPVQAELVEAVTTIRAESAEILAGIGGMLSTSFSVQAELVEAVTTIRELK